MYKASIHIYTGGIHIFIVQLESKRYNFLVLSLTNRFTLQTDFK